MSDENETPKAEGPQPAGEAWKEVGYQFRELGESLAAIFQTAWQDEAVRRQAQEMKTGLEALVKDVGQAIKETAASPEMQQAKSEATRAAESVRAAGEQTVQEVRPHLVEALRQVNQELQRLIGRMERSSPDDEPQGPASSPENQA
jgi:hypothetical protein